MISATKIEINQKDKNRWVTVPPLPCSLRFGMGGWFHGDGDDGEQDMLPQASSFLPPQRNTLSSHLCGRCVCPGEECRGPGGLRKASESLGMLMTGRDARCLVPRVPGLEPVTGDRCTGNRLGLGVKQCGRSWEVLTGVASTQQEQLALMELEVRVLGLGPLPKLSPWGGAQPCHWV